VEAIALESGHCPERARRSCRWTFLGGSALSISTVASWKNIRGTTERFPPDEERNQATMTKPIDIMSPNGPEKQSLLQDPYDFSLILGGPLYQLLRRTYLSGDALDRRGPLIEGRCGAAECPHADGMRLGPRDPRSQGGP
jgi:hypothetical protein